MLSQNGSLTYFGAEIRAYFEMSRAVNVQYCAKVMQMYVDEFRSFSGLFGENERNFGEILEAYCFNCCEISLWLTKLSSESSEDLAKFRAKFLYFFSLAQSTI